MEDDKRLKRTSRYMSMLLRHKPEEANLDMTKDGWVLMSQLVKILELIKV